MAAELPPEVADVLREFRVCEFTTIAKDGTPLAWPVCARYNFEEGFFTITTSIGLPQKAYNIRRNPKVALLFSEPTGSGLSHPASVLVQGDAVAPDKLVTSVNENYDYWRYTIIGRQPSSKMVSGSWLMRKLMGWWYYSRIIIRITPRAFLWWPNSDFSEAPQKLEVSHVG